MTNNDFNSLTTVLNTQCPRFCVTTAMIDNEIYNIYLFRQYSETNLFWQKFKEDCYTLRKYST